jgi:hypothetical protein
MHARMFAPREFIDQLANEALIPPVALIGWTKVEKDAVEVLQFSPAQNCAEWIGIPADLILSVEYLGMATCDHHRHPIVRLHLAPPSDEHQRALFLLLGSIAATAARRYQSSALRNQPQARGFGPACRACMAGCQSIQDYYAMVACSEDCMGSACSDPIVV